MEWECLDVNLRRQPQHPSPRPVGELLGAELEVRGWTQADFAAILDRPTQFVCEVVAGKKAITRESASQIGAALGQTAEFWLQTQNRYLLAELVKGAATQRKLRDIRRRAVIYRMAPIRALQKRKLLRSSNLDDLEVEVMELLELKSLDDEPPFAPFA